MEEIDPFCVCTLIAGAWGQHSGIMLTDILFDSHSGFAANNI